MWKSMPKEALYGITKNSTLKLEGMIKQSEDKLSLMTVEAWVSVCRHFKEAEKIYVKNEDVMDRFHENSL
jgi:hypothetical protein